MPAASRCACPAPRRPAAARGGAAGAHRRGADAARPFPARPAGTARAGAAGRARPGRPRRLHAERCRACARPPGPVVARGGGAGRAAAAPRHAGCWPRATAEAQARAVAQEVFDPVVEKSGRVLIESLADAPLDGAEALVAAAASGRGAARAARGAAGAGLAGGGGRRAGAGVLPGAWPTPWLRAWCCRQHAEVANAVGAAVAVMRARAVVDMSSSGLGAYRVHHRGRAGSASAGATEALALARRLATSEARAERAARPACARRHGGAACRAHRPARQRRRRRPDRRDGVRGVRRRARRGVASDVAREGPQRVAQRGIGDHPRHLVLPAELAARAHPGGEGAGRHQHHARIAQAEAALPWAA